METSTSGILLCLKKKRYKKSCVEIFLKNVCKNA